METQVNTTKQECLKTKKVGKKGFHRKIKTHKKEGTINVNVALSKAMVSIYQHAQLSVHVAVEYTPKTHTQHTL